jgi:hypothetical protein
MGKTLKKLCGHKGADDGITKKLKPFIGRRYGTPLNGRGMGYRRGKKALIRKLMADDLLGCYETLVEPQDASLLQYFHDGIDRIADSFNLTKGILVNRYAELIFHRGNEIEHIERICPQIGVGSLLIQFIRIGLKGFGDKSDDLG